MFSKKILKLSFNPRKDKIIAYRNKTVDLLTKWIREILYDSPKDKYVAGERLMFTNYYEHGSRAIFYTSHEFTVRSVTINNIALDGELFKVYQLGYRDMIFNKIHEDDEKRFELFFENYKIRLKDNISRNRYNKKQLSELWKEYYEKRSRLDIPAIYSYAITIHKSQGSTYRRVFLDIPDVECIKYYSKDQFKRALYTAVTRTSEKLYCKT